MKKSKNKISIGFILFTSLVFIISLPLVKAPCCAEGCYPYANCCVPDCCAEGVDPCSTNPFCGKGVVGCPAKIGVDIQYHCVDVLFDGADDCATCMCRNETDCSWKADIGEFKCANDYFCSIGYEGQTALSSECIDACPEGTRLCSDNTCAPICYPEVVCDGDCENGKGDSCYCEECWDKQASCKTELVCDEYTQLCIGGCPCPLGTTLCTDGYCRSDCWINGGPGNTLDNGIPGCSACDDPEEGCTVPACDSKIEPCDPNLYCHNGKCTAIPGDCPTCEDCEYLGDECTIDKCHSCDLSQCYWDDSCKDCSDATDCSEFNQDKEACNGGCDEKNCYWKSPNNCADCADEGVDQCGYYPDQVRCEANPCKLNFCCRWKNDECISTQTNNCDPDYSLENCENYNSVQLQGICDYSGEINCWDKYVDKYDEPKSCCGDDGNSDKWKNDDGSWCVNGVYFKSCNDNEALSSGECVDKSINCWSTYVSVAYEDSELTRCCEQNEYWTYSANDILQNILISQSCVITEWYNITRHDTVTYFELYR